MFTRSNKETRTKITEVQIGGERTETALRSRSNL